MFFPYQGGTGVICQVSLGLRCFLPVGVVRLRRLQHVDWPQSVVPIFRYIAVLQSPAPRYSSARHSHREIRHAPYP